MLTKVGGRLSHPDARASVGAMYSILRCKVDPKMLKHACDWKGVIENHSRDIERAVAGREHLMRIFPR